MKSDSVQTSALHNNGNACASAPTKQPSVFAVQQRKVLAENLQRLMEERLNLDTQVKVSRAAKISQSTVGRFLKGTVAATLDNLEALARVFDVSISALIEDREKNPELHSLDYRIRDLPPAERRRVLEHAELVLTANRIARGEA